MVDILESFYDPQMAATVLAAIAAFATVVTLMMPYMSGSKLSSRMRTAAIERDKLRSQRLQQLAADKKGPKLRSAPKSYMQRIVDALYLRKALETEGTRDRLKMAGFRGQAPMVGFLFFRVAMPVVCLLAAIFYLFVLGDYGMPLVLRVAICLGAAYIGFYLPSVFVTNLIHRRQTSIRRAFPDALDLMLICVQSGMSVEAAFAKVASEIGGQSIELAEELTLCTAELSYLQERRQALENLGKRTGLPGVKAVGTSLIQAERYGTPVSQALRVLAQENRDERMSEAEKKAAALPPKLTVPMITFFLPVLFVVLLGPAAIQVMEIYK